MGATMRYAILTAAKNEADYIERTLESVLRQTLEPVRWSIFDDGSDDRTPEILQEYARRVPFIAPIFGPARSGRSFGAQYRGLNAAYEATRHLQFDAVAVQDADIALAEPDYYERLMAELARDPSLGLLGGAIWERSGKVSERADGEDWRPRRTNASDSVAGGIQTFRRTCFEAIGGYRPLRFGGEDTLAQLEAERLGWRVAVLPDLAALHQRPSASAGGRLRGAFRQGMMDASLGSHPLFEALKCARRLPERPPVVASLVRMAGYLWWRLRGRAALVPPATAGYLRRRQIAKVYSAFRGAR